MTTPGNDSPTRLADLLQAQTRRLRHRYLLHGLAVTVLLPALAVWFCFALDHSLRLPLPIRLFHTAATVALLGYGAWRFLGYPLQKDIAALDMALVLERRFPDLHQRLVSVVQLQAAANGDLRNQSVAMIEALTAEAAAATAALPLHELFDARRTWRCGAGAALLLAGLVTGATLAPATARAFVLRHLGVAADYPRATTLRLELPPSGPELQRTDTADTTELVLPAGADLHVSVQVEGEVPAEVFLEVAPIATGGGEAPAARAVAMAPRPGERFRHVFRRLSGAFTFHARGGDDERGDRLVTVRTVHPPQVASIAASVTPPAYAGGAPEVQHGGAVEGLAGSAVELTVATTVAVPQATMVFLESGVRLPLTAVEVQDDSGKGTRHRGSFTITQSDRYQIELLADNGLRNPNPGTYPIAALQDYAPVGRWLLPDEDAPVLLAEALLCLRLEARDDFGLRDVILHVEPAATGTPGRSLLVAGGSPVRTLLRTELLEVKDLLAGHPGSKDGLSLRVQLLDCRAAGAQTTDLPTRIVQIVALPQLAESIAKGFRALREEATQSLELMADRRARLEELLAKGSTGPEAASLLSGIEVSQNRVATSCERLHRGLMRAFDIHLWNRLDPSPHAAAVVERYRAFSATLQEPVAYAPAFYRELLAARRSGALGAMETILDPILAMLAITDPLATTEAPNTARHFAEAQVARDDASRRAGLEQALAGMLRIEAALQKLLQRLEEWNDFQDLIQETRALRDRQRDLQSRTEEAKGKQ